MNDSKLFHESWHRIANQRISLRTRVEIKRQYFRGNKWYVIQDPFSNQFYRIRPNAYNFVARLRPDKTVEEVWQKLAEDFPDTVPGQGDIIELLAQLYHANLLQYELAPDSQKLFERYKKRKQKILKSNLMSILFFRVPLFDPDNLLKKLMPLIKLLFSPFGWIIWFGVVGWGAKVAIDNFEAIKVQTNGILAPSNLLLLYLTMAVVKTIHEFGHAFAVRRYGGECHTMGVMFLVFSPLPYMDASSSWTFRSRWKRALVGGAGMIFEVFLAAIAVMVWANTGSGLVNSIAYNMIFIASVSTVLFNLNPLLRFDGYYIFSDIIDFPNLHQQAKGQWAYLWEKFAFGVKTAVAPANNFKEAFWLVTFAVLSFIYRIFVTVSIFMFVADSFLMLGIVLAFIFGITAMVVPVYKAIKYLGSSPKLSKTRGRAISVCTALLVLAIGLLFVVPFPNSFKSAGVLKAREYLHASNKTRGYLKEIVIPSSSFVKKGDTLLIFENVELEHKINETQASLDENDFRHSQALNLAKANMEPIAQRIEFFEKQLDKLSKDQENLYLIAEMDGIWIAPEITDYLGMWVEKGTALGQLIDPKSFNFISVVQQDDASELFTGKKLYSEVRLSGQANHVIDVHNYDVIPMEQRDLPSDALGWGAGGDIAINQPSGDGQGSPQTSEPFFEVKANISKLDDIIYYHGRSGKIRFTLPMKPLGLQGIHKLRQLIQKRYQI